MGVHEISVVCRGVEKVPKNPCYVALVPVNNAHADHDAALPGWIRARDLLAGEDAVKAAGAKYLPRLEGQSDEDYAAYRAEDILNWRVGRVNGRNVPTLIVLRVAGSEQSFSTKQQESVPKGDKAVQKLCSDPATD